MQIEEAKKILKGMFYNNNGEKMHYIDFSDSYGDEWGGYTLPEYIEAIETVLNELEKKDNKIKELEGRCRNLDIEAQSYLEELMGDSTLKNRTIKQLNSELEKKDTVSKKQYNHLKKSLKGQIKKKEKVIDLMAQWINKQDIDEEICKNNITEPELCNEEGTNCRHCIKEYFYNKVRNNGIKRK